MNAFLPVCLSICLSISFLHNSSSRFDSPLILSHFNIPPLSLAILFLSSTLSHSLSLIFLASHSNPLLNSLSQSSIHSSQMSFILSLFYALSSSQSLCPSLSLSFSLQCTHTHTHISYQWMTHVNVVTNVTHFSLFLSDYFESK